MGRSIGIVLILIGCAGSLLQWMEGEKQRQSLMAEWVRLFARWEYVLKQQPVPLYEFLHFYETDLQPVHTFLEDVCTDMRMHACPSGKQIWQENLRRHKKTLRADGEMWEILLTAARAFYGESSMENIRCSVLCQKRTEQHLADTRAEFARKKRVYMPVGMLTGVVLVILLV